MSSRRPLVLVGGRPAELPQGDSLSPEINKFHGVESVTQGTFNDGTKVFTLPACTYWYLGARVICSANLTVDLTSVIAGGGSNKLYYVYFNDAGGAMVASATAWNLKTNIPLVAIYWSGTAGQVTYEYHNETRDIDWHQNAHNTIGARYESGLSLSGLGGTGTGATWAIGSGSVWDEDIKHSISAQSQVSPGARVWHQISASLYTFADTDYPFKWNGGTSRVQAPDPSTYTLTDVATNRYINVWAYATGDRTRPIHFFTPAQTSFTSATLARQSPAPNLSSFGLSQEIKLLYRLVYRGDGVAEASVSGDDYRIVSSLPGGSGGTVSASSVSFAPTGTVTSTNVQAAIEEVAALVGAPAVPVGNVVYVDAVNGDDATGLVERFDKPFLTLTAAVAAAVSGDTIEVRPGAYTVTSNLAKDGVAWYFHNGSVVTNALSPTSNPMWNCTSNADISIRGFGAFVGTTFIRNSGSGRAVFEFLSVDSAVSAVPLGAGTTGLTIFKGGRVTVTTTMVTVFNLGAGTTIVDIDLLEFPSGVSGVKQAGGGTSVVFIKRINGNSGSTGLEVDGNNSTQMDAVVGTISGVATGLSVGTAAIANLTVQRVSTSTRCFYSSGTSQMSVEFGLAAAGGNIANAGGSRVVLRGRRASAGNTAGLLVSATNADINISFVEQTGSGILLSVTAGACNVYSMTALQSGTGKAVEVSGGTLKLTACDISATANFATDHVNGALYVQSCRLSRLDSSTACQGSDTRIGRYYNTIIISPGSYSIQTASGAYVARLFQCGSNKATSPSTTVPLEAMTVNTLID